MKRTTASLLTGALAAGTFAALATLTPGIASATACGNTVVTNENAAAEGWLIPSYLAPNSGASAEFTFENQLVLDPGTGKVTIAYPIPGGRPLAEQTKQSEYGYEYQRFAGEPQGAGAPAYQLVLDLDGIPGNGIGFTTLSYEPTYQDSKPGTWWSSRDLGAKDASNPLYHNPALHGSNFWGTLDQISLAYPNATIDAFGINQDKTNGSPVSIDSIKFGCNTFSFELANRSPNPVITQTDAGDGDYRTFILSGRSSSDLDGDTLSFAWEVTGGQIPAGAPITSTASQWKVTLPNGPGEYSVKLTVTDEHGLSDTVTDTITATPPSNTSTKEFLPNTGAGVLGLAALTGLAVVGGGVGTVISRRRTNDA